MDNLKYLDDNDSQDGMEVMVFQSLEVLQLYRLPNLEGLWKVESLPNQIWEGLQSLRTLEICDCERLPSLPEGIRHLTSLEALTIWRCPRLEDRCKEGTGEDWDKIAHIPNIKFKW